MEQLQQQVDELQTQLWLMRVRADLRQIRV